MNRRALDVYDPKDATKVVAASGKQLLNFSQLRDDGSTMAGCWIFRLLERRR